jgi:RNA polymerase sigma-70 factor (ECF subfamily)
VSKGRRRSESPDPPEGAAGGDDLAGSAGPGRSAAPAARENARENVRENVREKTGRGETGRGDGQKTDRELVEEAQRGSHAAFEVLVRRYSERAYRVAYRVVRDPEMAQDILQEALIKAYRSLRGFEFRSAFYTWLYRIVVNLALDRRRRERGDHVEWEDEVARQTDPRAQLPPASDPELDTARAQVLGLVAEGIKQLPDGQREVLLLREVEGLSYEEIAATMRISKGTVMSRLHYARRKMMVFLREQGVDPEDVA